LPILSNLLIETNGKDEVKITGTDLEIGVTTTSPANITEPGAITVPAKKIYDIVREMPNGDINFNVTKNNSVHISATNDRSGSQFKIMGIPKDDYPKLINYSLENAVTLPQKALKECLSLTTFAISHDESRYVLNGALFILEGNEIKVVATDGRRLAFIKKRIQNPLTTSFNIIIPNKTISELIKLLGEDGEVKIVLEKNQIVFDFGTTHIVSRLIEGHFPNYEQVIPKEEKASVKIGRDSFLQAVKRASLLTSQESQAVKIELLKNKLAISSRSPNLGEAREEFPVDLKGEDMIIGFNPNYLLDVLKNIDVNEVVLSLSGSDRPGVIKGKEDYLYIIMPMQLTN
jgi:DNA polymerase-3 subunit beta